MPQRLTKPSATSVDIKLTQYRVLQALAEARRLPRQELARRAGFSPTAGTINSSLNGVPVGSSSGPARPGLLQMGLVRRVEITVDDGSSDILYEITPTGLEVLDSRLRQGPLPQVKDKTRATNKRYLLDQGDDDVSSE